MQPHGAHDEEQLYAHGPEGQDPAQSDAEPGLGVPGVGEIGISNIYIYTCVGMT